MAYTNPLTGIHGWFPGTRDVNSGWHLDIVSLLAVIGESAMEVHAQRTTVTWLCILPRLIPAPQGLLKAHRPLRLPPVPNVKVVGAFSAPKVEELNFAANLIHDIDNLEPLQFQEWAIGYDGTARVEPPVKRDDGSVEMGPVSNPSAASTNSDSPPAAQTVDRNAAQTPPQTGQTPVDMSGWRTLLESKRYNPVEILTVVSFLWTVWIFIWAFLIQDGAAALAIGLLSLTSSLTGLARWWEPTLDRRFTKDIVPPGDLVLKTRSGAFVVVHCHENIARELYMGPDRCKYHFKEKHARIAVGFGTLSFMVAVVLLGNCSWEMQAVIGLTYLTLNGAYWIVALLPEEAFWRLRGSDAVDLSEPHEDSKGRRIAKNGALLEKMVFEQKPKFNQPEKMKLAHTEDIPDPELTETKCFTRTLWYAIQRSKSKSWVRPLEAAPETPAWDLWLSEADQNMYNEQWKAVKRKGDFLKENVIPGPNQTFNDHSGEPARRASRRSEPATGDVADEPAIGLKPPTAVDTPMAKSTSVFGQFTSSEEPQQSGGASSSTP